MSVHTRSVVPRCCLLLMVLLAGCNGVGPQVTSTRSSTASAVPQPLATTERSATPTHARIATALPLPLRSPTIPLGATGPEDLTELPTPTLLAESAPRMPRTDVHFITHGDRNTPLVALTFDVGQMPANPAGFDEGIYRALLEHEVPATFFLGGDWMRTHISETRQLDRVAAFELGNHSWSHPDMRTLDEPAMASELIRTQDMMFRITGHQTRLFRLPSGLYNDLVLSVAAWHGLLVIQWDVVTADPVPDNTAENIVARVKDGVQNGSIIVMHGNGRGWHTAEALPAMIEFLQEEGYCLVTVSQMIGLDSVPAGCPPTVFSVD